MSSLVHASCVAIDGRGVLIAGRSGSGKSDLALRLIDRGAALVSDDYTKVQVEGGRLIASAPETIVGRIEVRGVGLVETPAVAAAEVALRVDLDAAPERLPEPESWEMEGLHIPSLALVAHEASAPIKLEAALRLFGLPRS
jgi:serine kinase of HPr protein (carbohydrate metabolism regulator)